MPADNSVFFDIEGGSSLSRSKSADADMRTPSIAMSSPGQVATIHVFSINREGASADAPIILGTRPTPTSAVFAVQAPGASPDPSDRNANPQVQQQPLGDEPPASSDHLISQGSGLNPSPIHNSVEGGSREADEGIICSKGSCPREHGSNQSASALTLVDDYNTHTAPAKPMKAPKVKLPPVGQS